MYGNHDDVNGRGVVVPAFCTIVTVGAVGLFLHMIIQWSMTRSCSDSRRKHASSHHGVPHGRHAATIGQLGSFRCHDHASESNWDSSRPHSSSDFGGWDQKRTVGMTSQGP